MSANVDAFSACEALLRKYAPLYLEIGEPLRKDRDPDAQMVGPWRPPTSARTRSRMQRLRRSGYTIEQIAKRCGVTWGTACRWSRIGGPKQ
jgi:hypothetical protein